MRLQVICPLDVTLGIGKDCPSQLLQMSGLCVHEELVYRRNLDVSNQAQVDPHTHSREQVHRFFAADLLGVLQRPVGPANLVEQVVLIFVD